MSSEWQKALTFSLCFHLCLAIGMLFISQPMRPSSPKIVRITLQPLAPQFPKEIKKTKTPKRTSPLKSKKKFKSLRTSNRLNSRSQKKTIIKKKRTKFSRRKRLKSPTKTSSTEITRQEEILLRKKLALLEAQAEERKLREKLQALSKNKGTLSLTSKEISPNVLAQIAAHLKTFWEVPVLLKDRKDLWAEVELSLAPDGRILSWHFRRSSGNSLFDEAVENTLKKANPLPAPGKSLLLPVIFKIQEE